MRPLLAVLIALCLLAGWAGPSSAAVPHIVQPGETLWSIAAANGFTTRSFAAYNGLGESSPVVLGSTLMVPTVAEATATLPAATPPATSGASAAAPAPMGAYTIQPGDTLSDIAARAGVSADQIAWMNGLSVSAPIVAGTALKLPTGAGAGGSAWAKPTSTAPAAPAAPPYPAGGSLSGDAIGSLGAAQGAPAALVKAVAWQESGWNNSMVSSTSARGIMQVMPGTWDWVQQNLSGPLDPSSPSANVTAGAAYLSHLLRATGGDVPTAVAGYYQGLGSVRSRGLYAGTQRYVADVLALRARFGG